MYSRDNDLIHRQPIKFIQLRLLLKRGLKYLNVITLMISTCTKAHINMDVDLLFTGVNTTYMVTNYLKISKSISISVSMAFHLYITDFALDMTGYRSHYA